MSTFALRLAGAVLLVMASAGAGFEAAARTQRRVREVRDLAAAVTVLATEVGYAQSRLPDALRRAARVASGDVATLLEAVAARVERRGEGPEEAWHEALSAQSSRLSARPEDLEGMAELVASLGRSDREDQTAHLRRAAARLGALADRLAPEADRTARLVRALGLLGGLAAAILVL